MKKLVYILIICFSIDVYAQNNLILNGSFEFNNAQNCYQAFNPWTWNTTVDYTYSYGSFISFMKDSCITCSSFPNYFWGGGAKDGHWLVNMGSKVFSGSLTKSKLSLQLNYPLSNEKNYKLSFFIKAPDDYPTDTLACYNPPSNYMKVGISNSQNQFGTYLIDTPLGTDEWKEYNIVFNTQYAEEYITLEVGGTNDTVQYNTVYIDNFVLVETTEPVSVNDIYSNNRQLLKIVGNLGRESKSNKKGLLFYIYSDGTVEKKITVE